MTPAESRERTDSFGEQPDVKIAPVLLNKLLARFLEHRASRKTHRTIALFLAVIAPYMPLRAQQAITVSITLTEPWTDSGIYLTPEQSIHVAARGTMNWYTGACDGQCLSTPAGIPCPGDGPKRLGLTCLSLIGKVGPAGRPFYVGESLTYTAPTAGEFFLGVNDDNLPDNTGDWTVTITSQTPFATRRPPITTNSAPATCDVSLSQSIGAEDAIALGRQAFKSRNFKAAGCWWTIAAKQDNTEAEFSLGIWYEYGQGGIEDHEQAMNWFRKAAAAGDVRTRDYLVCTSGAVKHAMKALFVAAGHDPDVQNMKMLIQLLTGMVENESKLVVTDLSPVDFSSATQFSCTATFKASREVQMDSEDGIQTLIPQSLASHIPILQTYKISKSSEHGNYTVTLSYVGSQGATTFPLSQPYSKIVMGPSW